MKWNVYKRKLQQLVGSACSPAGEDLLWTTAYTAQPFSGSICAWPLTQYNEAADWSWRYTDRPPERGRSWLAWLFPVGVATRLVKTVRINKCVIEGDPRWDQSVLLEPSTFGTWGGFQSPPKVLNPLCAVKRVCILVCEIREGILANCFILSHVRPWSHKVTERNHITTVNASK